jgi:hypothetical protein
VSENWATQSYAVNGTTPQSVNVQFSTQFDVALNNGTVPDGSTITGTSDFSDTLTLTNIIVTDANGNPVSGVTVTSSSGTQYPVNVPEPASLSLMAAAALGLLARHPRRRT